MREAKGTHLHLDIRDLVEENDKLHSILKELRDTIVDYIDNYNSFGDYEIHWECKKELLEILDKGNKE